MPFGATNAPAGFQRIMNGILEEFLDDFVIVYLDDILIFSKSLEQHEGHVQAVLEALHKAGMILNWDKCRFCESEVRFLGHIVSKDGLKPDPTNSAGWRKNTETLDGMNEWTSVDTESEDDAKFNVEMNANVDADAELMMLMLMLMILIADCWKEGESSKIKWMQGEVKISVALKAISRDKDRGPNPQFRKIWGPILEISHNSIGAFFEIDQKPAVVLYSMNNSDKGAEIWSKFFIKRQ
jgi:hypothetical protein